jgi:hypothetical protein
MAYIVMAYIVMAYIGMAYIVTAYILVAYIVMAYILMAYIVMAYIGDPIRRCRCSRQQPKPRVYFRHARAHAFTGRTRARPCRAPGGGAIRRARQPASWGPGGHDVAGVSVLGGVQQGADADVDAAARRRRGLDAAYIVMAYIVMAYIVMAYIVMAYIVMAYIVMAEDGEDSTQPRLASDAAVAQFEAADAELLQQAVTISAITM